ncbi:DUF523 domain-containing protein [Chitinivorax sp. B]|uniref:DUF523 domain-containing protein n=1 Tax=Chitinivorax sp. B TaxID=2502235 RepID=UPI0010F840B5|nr:DUF523 domain-containing protein [Chitinivorax sp. B]
MDKILVSACLLGSNVRYNAEPLPDIASILLQWQSAGRLVPICPEVAGGLPIPRLPAELVGGDGRAMLLGKSQVRTAMGDNVSQAFIDGAQLALHLACEHGVKMAILKARSPSCGNEEIYDGHFASRRIPGVGVTAALLTEHGITVFSEEQLEEALAFDQATGCSVSLPEISSS